VCLKIGHTANKCWHHFEEDYVPESHSAAAVSSGHDNNWYTDSSATDHITRDLDKLTMHDHYPGHEQIHAAYGTCMDITHISKTVIPTTGRNLVLDNVLHVPATQKNIISVHRFTLDNDTFIEFHLFFFLIKDQKTRKVLLHSLVKAASTLFYLPHQNSGSSFSVPSKSLLIDGIVDWVILPKISFAVSCL
jgi:hypothetical protein